jgi:hypothetical protein
MTARPGCANDRNKTNCGIPQDFQELIDLRPASEEYGRLLGLERFKTRIGCTRP